MRFALTPDQQALRDALREVLVRECSPSVVRAAWSGSDPAKLWAELAGLGLTGALVAPAHGGLGLSDVDAVALLGEVGYAAVPLPVGATVAVAGPALAVAGDPTGVLPDVASGRSRVSLVGPSGLAPFGRFADLFLSLSSDAIHLASRDDVALSEVSTVDGSRAMVRVSGGATVVCTVPGVVALARDRATLAVAAELVGVGRRMLDLTVGYVGQRRQFGVPVGSFQAVKHQLATVLQALAFAEPAVLRAACSSLTGAPTRSRDVSMAYVLAHDASQLAARTAIQCHGALGYTVEYDLHLFAKRAWALAAEGGGVDEHLDRVGKAIGVAR